MWSVRLFHSLLTADGMLAEGKCEVILLAKKRLKMSTSREVRQAVNRIANMLLNGEIDPKTGNAILYAANVTLGAIRVDEQQQKLDELERTVEEMKKK